MEKRDYKLKSKAATAWIIAGIAIIGLSLFILWWVGLIFFIIAAFVEAKKH